MLNLKKRGWLKRYRARDRRLREKNKQKWEEQKKVLKKGKWFIIPAIAISIIITILFLFWAGFF